MHRNFVIIREGGETTQELNWVEGVGQAIDQHCVNSRLFL